MMISLLRSAFPIILLAPSAAFRHLVPNIGRHLSSPSSRRLTHRDMASNSDTMDLGQKRIQQIHKLLKGLETGDPNSIEDVIHPDTYVQHNPQTNTDKQGLKDLFARISKTNPHVNFVRSFSDGDYVFLHTEYDFNTRRIGFEVFRFEDLLTVEHWDNIMPRKPASDKNPSGRSMVDGSTEVKDLGKTEDSRVLTRRFFETVASVSSSGSSADPELMKVLDDLCSLDLIQHNPDLADGRSTWFESMISDDTIKYQTVHRVLAQGNFCLCVTEGYIKDDNTAFYDLVRFEDGRIVEHWDTRESVAPKETWKNQNGKF